MNSARKMLGGTGAQSWSEIERPWPYALTAEPAQPGTVFLSRVRLPWIGRGD